MVLKVKPKLRARLSYALKSKCGRAHGTVSLKIKHGRFQSGGRSRTADAASGRFTKGGQKVKGVIDRPTTARRTGDRACKLGPRHFAAKLSLARAARASCPPTSATTRAPTPPAAGSASTSSTAPTARRSRTSPWTSTPSAGATTTATAWTTTCSCTSPATAARSTKTAATTSTTRRTTTPSSSSTARSPTGRPRSTSWSGGHFNPDGTPNLVGTYECDSWGDTYAAAVAH